MSKTVSAVALVLAFTLPVYAQQPQKASKEEAEKVLAALKQIGCETEADEIEKEKSGVFEIDDAKCKIGQYDIKVTPDYKILSITAD
jgi:hypothetical protein